MPRSQFVDTVTVPLGQQGGLMPVAGIAATPYNVNPDGTTGSQANAFSDRTSSVPGTTVTDASGTVSFYLDDGDYDVHFEDQLVPPRITPFIRSFKSAPLIVDSGWDAISSPLQAVVGAYGMAARQIGDLVYLRGAGKYSSGSPLSGGSILGVIPSALGPAENVNTMIPMGQVSTQPIALPIQIQPGGNIMALFDATRVLANNDIFYFDSVFYSLD